MPINILTLGRFIVIFLILLSSYRCCPTKSETKRVLVVHSYEKNYPAYSDFNALILEGFRSNNIDADVQTFYLDCESFIEIQELERLYHMFNSLTEWKPDIILVNDDQATYSLLKCGHPLSKEIPIVFAGVNYPNWDLLKGFTNVTGSHDKIDFYENIKVVEEITKGKALVYAFIDSTYLDRKTRKDLEEQLLSNGIPIEINQPMLDILSDRQNTMDKRTQTTFRLTSLRYRSASATLLWNMGRYSNFSYYLQTKRDYMSINIGNLASNMSFSAINEGFGYGEGLLGGYFTTLETQIAEQVKTATLILKGTNPAHIPIYESHKQYVMDWDIMRRWHLGKNDIPNKYKIINIPLYEQYFARFAILTVILIGAILYLITYLIYIYRREVVRKREVMENLKQEKESLAQSVITLKEREQELIEARELADKAELKQSFLANMSHEIRTPLNAIVGFSNLLASEDELQNEEKQEYIQVINSNCKMLLKLINDILELSRIESGYMSFTYDFCSVKALVEDIYLTHQMLIPEHLQFIKEFPEADRNIKIDKYRLTQVITNFLNNATKFTSQGYIKLGYEYLSDKKQVNIYVEDSGKGIPLKEQKMIFRRFYKQDEFAQGTGIGLSICQVIIEKLNGKIYLQSEPGQGSRFTVTFPCK